MLYHLRVSVISRDTALKVVELFKAKFKLSKIVCSFETANEDNFHLHFHLEYEDEDASSNAHKTKRSEFFKKLKKEKLIPDIENAVYHSPLKKTEKENLSYVIKDKDVLYKYGIPEDVYAEAEEYSERINEEKKQSMKEQLLNAWKWRQRLFIDKLEAFMFIDSYHVERDYLPPNFTNKIQYALYIVYKLQHFKKSRISFYSLVSSLNGIKQEDISLSDYDMAAEADNDIIDNEIPINE